MQVIWSCGFSLSVIINVNIWKLKLSAGIPEAVVVVFSSLSPTAVPSVTKLDACKDLTACAASGTPLITRDWLIKGGLGGDQEHKAGQDTQQQ